MEIYYKMWSVDGDGNKYIINDPKYDELVSKINSLRKKLQDFIEKETSHLEGIDKTMLIENVLFNLWYKHLDIIIDNDQALGSSLIKEYFSFLVKKYDLGNKESK